MIEVILPRTRGQEDEQSVFLIEVINKYVSERAKKIRFPHPALSFAVDTLNNTRLSSTCKEVRPFIDIHVHGQTITGLFEKKHFAVLSYQDNSI